MHGKTALKKKYKPELQLYTSCLRFTIFRSLSSLTDSTAHIQPKILYLYRYETDIWMLVILTLNDLPAFPSINGLTRTCFGAYLRGRVLLCLVNMSVCLCPVYRVDAHPAGQSVPFPTNRPKIASLLKAGLSTHLKSFCLVYVTFWRSLLIICTTWCGT